MVSDWQGEKVRTVGGGEERTGRSNRVRLGSLAKPVEEVWLDCGGVVWSLWYCGGPPRQEVRSGLTVWQDEKMRGPAETGVLPCSCHD